MFQRSFLCNWTVGDLADCFNPTKYHQERLFNIFSGAVVKIKVVGGGGRSRVKPFFCLFKNNHFWFLIPFDPEALYFVYKHSIILAQ